MNGNAAWAEYLVLEQEVGNIEGDKMAATLKNIVDPPNSFGQPVPWKRLWSPIDAKESVQSQEGFLYDPTWLLAPRESRSLRPLDELLDGVQCLVLLGEPGMGKSTALEQAIPAIEQQALAEGGLFRRSFRDVFDSADLLSQLEQSTEWKNWADGERKLAVVIDGLDEGLATVPHLLNILASRLRGKPILKLHMILTCRESDWPKECPEFLGLWQGPAFAAFRLQRLTRNDVLLAGKVWGLKGETIEHFIQAVESSQVQSFAARPITLKMLVGEYQANGTLPTNRSEIFERGCGRLCTEDGERSRRLGHVRGKEVEPKVRFKLAGRIASAMLLGQFTKVSNSPVEAREKRELGVGDLAGQTGEDEKLSDWEVTLESALFRAAGPGRRAFAHQSFAEFMAAKHLKGFHRDQLLQLLCIRSGNQHVVVPQLRELAAWVGLLHQEFFDWLVNHEPEVLLRNDASALTERQRASAVGSVLRRIERGETFDDWNLKRFYRSFNHPGLAEQVRPYIIGKLFNLFVRRAAIHFVRLCQYESWVDDLMAVALDQQESLHLREESLKAVAKFLPADRVGELEPFAENRAGADPNDELRGIALMALVPRHWSVARVLPHLNTGHNPNFFGSFLSACRSYLPDQIEPGDLPCILDSFQKRSYPFHTRGDPVAAIAERAILLALRNLEEPRIGGSVVALARSKLFTGELPQLSDIPGCKELLESNPEIRHRLVDLFSSAPGMTAPDLTLLRSFGLIPVLKSDFEWVLKSLSEANEAVKPFWIRLAATFSEPESPMSSSEAAKQACDRFPELAAAIQLRREQSLKREMVEKEAAEKRQRQTKPPSRMERFSAALKKAASNWREWPALASELQNEKDEDASWFPVADPTKRIAWLQASAQEQAAVINAARGFIVCALPGPTRGNPRLQCCPEEWWALWLLRTEICSDPVLHGAVVKKWFHALLAQPLTGCADVEEQELASIAIALDQKATAKTLGERMDSALSENLDETPLLKPFSGLWRPAFTGVALEFLARVTTQTHQLEQVVRFVAPLEPGTIQIWLRNEIEVSLNRLPTVDPLLPTFLALELSLFAMGGPLPKWWPKLNGHPDLAARFVRELTRFQLHWLQKPLNQFGPSLLGEIYFHARRTIKPLPPAEDNYDPVPSVLLEIRKKLVADGTEEACEALHRLAETISEDRSSLLWDYRDAKTAFLEKSWSGVPLKALIALSSKANARWVRGVDDLFELILDSLQRFKSDRSAAMVRGLWNEKPNKDPKPEDVLTEEIAAWLRDDLGPKNGVAVACQVSASPVSETDIEVTSALVHPRPRGQQFCVTIEVKRHFNSEVVSSVREQLVEAYLLGNRRTHGIYLVGWYGRFRRGLGNPLRAKTFDEATNKLTSVVEDVQLKYPELRLAPVCLNCEFPTAFRNAHSSKQKDSKSPHKSNGRN